MSQDTPYSVLVKFEKLSRQGDPLPTFDKDKCRCPEAIRDQGSKYSILARERGVRFVWGGESAESSALYFFLNRVILYHLRKVSPIKVLYIISVKFLQLKCYSKAG
jgi:hypothetical protein